jgi:CBS domain-containing protein
MTKTEDIEFHQQRIRAIDCSPALVVTPQAPLREVILQMQHKGCGCAVVCEGGAIQGTFTERSVLTSVVGQDIDLSRPVGEFTNRSVPSVSLDDTVDVAIRHMDQHNVRHLPIVAGGDGVVGILSVRDVIDLLAQYHPSEVYNLPPRLRQKMEKPEGA